MQIEKDARLQKVQVVEVECTYVTKTDKEQEAPDKDYEGKP